MKHIIVILALLGASATSARAGWWDDLLRKAEEMRQAPAATPAVSALSDEEVVRGLKEALSQGTRQAISQLGREGGYLHNLDVRIPLPDDLKKVEKVLRTFRQDRYADEFIASLNHAAERAVPEAAAIIADSVAKMTLEDARGILKGADDAATQYFRKTGEARLRERFRPIVEAATDQAGVTAAYKKFINKAGAVTQLMGGQASDLDGYVTDRALDGLFKMIAAEEQRIRQDPLARGSDLLKKVFGLGKG